MEEVNHPLKVMASEILEASILPHVAIWLTTATKNEIKGLKVVYAIFKHQGTKRFRPKASLNDSLLQNSADQLRKKYMRSYYNAEFCGTNPLGQETDILRYKRIGELRCAEVLNQLCLQYVESWLSLKDDLAYQSLMLAFLRGIYSVAKTQAAVPSSSQRESYMWVKSDTKRSTPENLRVVRSGLEAKQHKKRAESLQVHLKPAHNTILYNPLAHKIKHQQNLKGNGEITSWVSHIANPNTSLYQDSYIPMYLPHIHPAKADFNTSMVSRLLPHLE